MNELRSDPTTIVMIAGRWVADSAPVLPAALPGVMRGEGIFETFMVDERGLSPFLPQHAERLLESARRMRIELDGRGLLEEWPEFAAGLPPRPLRVRYTVLRGQQEEAVRIWTAGPASPHPPAIDLAVARMRCDPEDPLAGAKITSRAGYQLARREAREQGAWDALIGTIEGDFTECTTSNLFLWRDGKLRTPPLARGLLAGVTRWALLEAAQTAGIRVSEEKIWLSELQSAEEIFVTSAVLGLIPVQKILGVREDLPGEAGRELPRVRTAYLEQVERALSSAQT